MAPNPTPSEQSLTPILPPPTFTAVNNHSTSSSAPSNASVFTVKSPRPRPADVPEQRSKGNLPPHRTLISQHLSLSEDKTTSPPLANVTNLNLDQRPPSPVKPKRRQRRARPNIGGLYVEDPPGTVRPLTPPATRRKGGGRRKISVDGYEQKSTTSDGLQVVRPGVSGGNEQDEDRAVKDLDAGREAHDDDSEHTRAFNFGDLQCSLGKGTELVMSTAEPVHDARRLYPPSVSDAQAGTAVAPSNCAHNTDAGTEKANGSPHRRAADTQLAHMSYSPGEGLFWPDDDLAIQQEINAHHDSILTHSPTDRGRGGSDWDGSSSYEKSLLDEDLLEVVDGDVRETKGRTSSKTGANHESSQQGSPSCQRESKAGDKVPGKAYGQEDSEFFAEDLAFEKEMEALEDPAPIGGCIATREFGFVNA